MRTLSAGRASLLSTMQPEQLASHATCEWTKRSKPVQSSSACMWRCWVRTVIVCAVHYSMICAEESQVLLRLCRSPCSKQLLSASARTLLQVCAGFYRRLHADENGTVEECGTMATGPQQPSEANTRGKACLERCAQHSVLVHKCTVGCS